MKETGRIQIHGDGIGELSDADIERRAAELARMDGRSEVGEQDRFRAKDELLHPGPSPAPEADETSSPVELWSKGEASQPHRGVRTDLDDEQNAAEQLVNEGVEEADRDQRLSAGEEAPLE